MSLFGNEDICSIRVDFGREDIGKCKYERMVEYLNKQKACYMLIYLFYSTEPDNVKMCNNFIS